MRTLGRPWSASQKTYTDGEIGEQRAEAPVAFPGERYPGPERAGASPLSIGRPLFPMGRRLFCCPAAGAFPAAIPPERKGWYAMSKGKRPNLNLAGTMDIDAWRDRQVTKRLKARLAAQTQEFMDRRGGDTDEQLRAYVRRRAEALRRMPHPLEIRGGIYLSKRLGDWARLAKELGFAPVGREEGRKAYKRLREREAELFAQARKAEKEAKRQQRLQRLKDGKTTKP